MELKYGAGSFQFVLPPEYRSKLIQPKPPTPSVSPETIIAEALDTCRGIFDEFMPGEKVLIVTSDITRYTGSEVYLPLLVDLLNKRGVRDADIEILIALGIHRRQTDQEHRKILGRLYGRINVTDHDCDNPADLICIGRTSGGIDICINRRAVEADRLILTGTIGFHYFAGFGGGRKSLLPGIAGRKACMASHFAVLNQEPRSGRNLLATTGVLQGNPVHQGMVEACAMAAPDLIINTLLTPDKQILAAFAGHWQEAHEQGCRCYREWFSYPLENRVDLVIVSCGGYPKDINVIQSHKAMEYASHALKEGGVMILLAECRDGFGHPTFFDWFRYKQLDDFETALRAHYEINGQTAYSLLMKARKFSIILISSLTDTQVLEMGMRPARSLDDAMALAKTMLPADAEVAVIPEGGSVLPVISEPLSACFSDAFVPNA